MSNYCRYLAAVLVGASLIVGAPTATAANNVAKIVDGDTITMSNGEKVRLIQIDTPELASKECYASQARAELIKLLNQPSDVSLSIDPNLDLNDRYGRSLRYVFIGNTNINLKLVEIGAAAPYFYRKEKGIYASQLLKAAQVAQKNGIGLWGACPGTRLSPDHALQTRTKKVSTR
jgi:micrococcal nuclease